MCLIDKTARQKSLGDFLNSSTLCSSVLVVNPMVISSVSQSGSRADLPVMARKSVPVGIGLFPNSAPTFAIFGCLKEATAV